MKSSPENLLDLLRREMEFRNYSKDSIRTYCDLMSRLRDVLNTSLEFITPELFKGYL